MPCLEKSHKLFISKSSFFFRDFPLDQGHSRGKKILTFITMICGAKVFHNSLDTEKNIGKLLFFKKEFKRRKRILKKKSFCPKLVFQFCHKIPEGKSILKKTRLKRQYQFRCQVFFQREYGKIRFNICILVFKFPGNGYPF